MATTRRTKSSKSVIPQLAWHAVREAPLVLVSGPQDFLASRTSALLREQVYATDPATETTDIDAADYQPGELFTYASPSLFGEPRLIRVSHVEKCTDAFLTDALEYLAAPADDTCVLLRHGGGNRGKRLLDRIRQASDIALEVVCPELKRDSERFDFAREEFQRAGTEATPAALRMLTAAFSSDVGELAAACQQLISDTAGAVDTDAVERYYGGRVEATAFAAADAAVAGRTTEALVALRHALESGADPVPIVAAFAMKIRAMAKVKGARGTSAELGKTLGMAPWQVDRARRDGQAWSDAQIGAALTAAADADAAVKGAERSPAYAVERLALQVADRGGQRFSTPRE